MAISASATHPESDKTKLMNLLTEFGVGFTLGDGGNVCCSVNDAKIEGYTGFVTEFAFDQAGQFLKMDIWE